MQKKMKRERQIDSAITVFVCVCVFEIRMKTTISKGMQSGHRLSRGMFHTKTIFFHFQCQNIKLEMCIFHCESEPCDCHILACHEYRFQPSEHK